MHGRVPTTDHDDVLIAEEKAVAGGARTNAAADEVMLARHVQIARRGAHRQDDGPRVHGVPVGGGDRLDRAHANDKIRIVTNSVVVAVEGDTTVTGLRLRDTATGKESTLAVTGVFVAIGHDPRSELVRGVVDVDSDGYVLVEGNTTHTSLDGVFAAGDLVDHTYRQAVTAAGTGCSAAIDAERWLTEQAESAEPAQTTAAGAPATATL